MLPVETPFKTYTGLDGKPLDGGFVYFGQPGQNPTTSPVTVYWDAAGTQPAKQPLRTTNGYIMRAGTPANVFFSGSYSELVQDSKGRQVFYSRTSDDFSIATAVSNFLSSLTSSSGSSVIGFIQAGAGTISRWVQDKLRERVSVMDFGAKGDGATDDTAAIQAAINSFGASAGKLYFPRGVYKISSALLVTLSGMQLEGDSPSNTYLTTSAGAFDLLKVAGAYVRVSGIQFRPGGNQLCMRVYAAHCTVENNRFLAAANNAGTAILLTDTDPDTGATVAGAYTHRVTNNVIGLAGYAFAHGIDDGSTNGIQACDFIGNQFCSDSPVRMTKGGANTYIGNLFQSSTGTTGAPAGQCLDLGTNVSAEQIMGNYFERYQYGVLMRNASATNQVAYISGNHYDNVTTKASSTTGVLNYLMDDPDGARRVWNGWQDDYSSTTYRGFKTAAGANVFGYTSNGYFCVGVTSSSYHQIKQAGTQGGVLLDISGGARDCYFQIVDGAGGNGSNTALNLGANSVTGRSLNGGGTLNAAGADYAEYLIKEVLCGVIAKGQIIGITANDEITDRWADAVAFAIKSTNPSYVGGDTWAAHLGARPAPPDASASPEQIAEYEAAAAQYDADLEAARQRVDRIAFAGRVPVNVQGATPGQFIVAEPDGAGGIKGVAVTAPTFEQYMRAVGKVTAIEPDGRARVIVKVA